MKAERRPQPTPRHVESSPITGAAAPVSPAAERPGQKRLGSPMGTGGSSPETPRPSPTPRAAEPAGTPAPATPTPDSAPPVAPAAPEPATTGPRRLRPGRRRAAAPDAAPTPAPASPEPATAPPAAPEPVAPEPIPAAPAAPEPTPAAPEPPAAAPSAPDTGPAPVATPPSTPDTGPDSSPVTPAAPPVAPPPPPAPPAGPPTPAAPPPAPDPDAESGWTKFWRGTGKVVAAPIVGTAWAVGAGARGVRTGARYLHSRFTTVHPLAQPIHNPTAPHTVDPDTSVYVIGNEHPEQPAQQLAQATVRRWYRRKHEPDINTPTRRGNEPGLIRKWTDKAIVHAMETMFVGRLAKKAENILRSTDDMLALPKTPQIRKQYDGEKVSHARWSENQANKTAQAVGIEEQYRGGFNYGHHRLGENVLAVDKNGQFYKDVMAELIEPMVTGGQDMTPAEVQATVRRLVRRHEVTDAVLQQVLKDDRRNIDQRMLADNILEKAALQREHADDYRNNVRSLTDEVELVFADLKGGARSEVKKTRGVDSVIGFIQDKMRGTINATTLATGSAASILLLERGLSAVTRMTDTTTFYLTEYLGHGLPAYLAVPAAIAGGFSLLRGIKEANVDRALHNREEANGARFDPKSPGRAKMQRRVVHEGETAARYISDSTVALSKTETRVRPGLQTRIEAVATNPTSQDAKQELIHLIGEVMARRNLSDLAKKKSDTYKSDQYWTLDQGDQRLRAKIREGIAHLGNTMSQEDINNALTDSVKFWEKEIRKGIRKQDWKFAVRKGVDSTVKGLITGVTVLGTGELFRGAWWGLHELFRGSTVSKNLAAGKTVTIDGVTMRADQSGKVTFNNGVGPQPNVYYEDGKLITTEDLSYVSPSMVAEMNKQGYVAHAALQDSPAVIDSRVPANANIHLDHGMRLVPGQNGTFAIWSQGENTRMLADGIRFDSVTGNVIPGSLHVDSNLIGVVREPGSVRVVDSRGYFADYTGKVGHQSYGNERWRIDHNEFGVRNHIIGDDGVRWSVEMTDNGSWNGRHPERVHISNLIRNDELFWAIWDPKLNPDVPGGKNHPFVVKPNEAGGSFHLLQSASPDTMITVMVDGKEVQMSEAELARFTYKANLGDFTSNSNYNHKEAYFKAHVSPVTYQKIGDEWVVGHLATSPGEGLGDTSRIIVTEQTNVNGATVIDIPLDRNDSDFGLPGSHSERKPMGRVIKFPYSRTGTTTSPDGGNPSSVSRTGSGVRTNAAINAPAPSRQEGASQVNERGQLQEYLQDAIGRGLTFDEALGLYNDVKGILKKRENNPEANPTVIAAALREHMMRHLFRTFRGDIANMGSLINAYLSYTDVVNLKNSEFDWSSDLTNFAHAYRTYQSINGIQDQPAVAA